jgi:predicted nucleic acid-binding protein
MLNVGIKHNEVNIFWRPCLSDPDDEMILELAVHARADYIVTHNIKDFKKIKGFRVKAITPREFLRILQEEK